MKKRLKRKVNEEVIMYIVKLFWGCSIIFFDSFKFINLVWNCEDLFILRF